MRSKRITKKVHRRSDFIILGMRKEKVACRSYAHRLNKKRKARIAALNSTKNEK